MNTRFMTAAFLWLLLAVCGQADICAVKDIGLKPDDPQVDNAAILTAAIRDGKVNDTVHFPGGAYYASSEVNDQHKTGLAFEGQGIATWSSFPSEFSHGRTGKPQRGGMASVRWIYTGDGVAWRISGNGSRIKGINFWHGWQPRSNDAIRKQWGESIAILFEHAGAQNGQWNIDHLAICGFDQGLSFTSDSQCDESEFGQLWLESNRTHIHCDNEQSTGLKFRHLTSRGVGEFVFDVSMAGNFDVGTLYLNDPRTVWRFRRTGANTFFYSIQNFKADNNAAGWLFATMDKAGPVSLYARGLIGMKAKPAQDRPQLLDYMGQPPKVDVRLNWAGGWWPEAASK